MTALVGPSGGGKSTIANLLLRFWDVQEGVIAIGGVPIREMGTEKLMDTVSFVFQDVHLFYDTIEANIRMGNTAAPMEDVIAAAKTACCHEFIVRLEHGYDTKIGEGGTYLSGGEAQRIAIARALLKTRRSWCWMKRPLMRMPRTRKDPAGPGRTGQRKDRPHHCPPPVYHSRGGTDSGREAGGHRRAGNA